MWCIHYPDTRVRGSGLCDTPHPNTRAEAGGGGNLLPPKSRVPRICRSAKIVTYSLTRHVSIDHHSSSVGVKVTTDYYLFIGFKFFL